MCIIVIILIIVDIKYKLYQFIIIKNKIILSFINNLTGKFMLL
jgi:Tfp pilus assembly major pilin PilA